MKGRGSSKSELALAKSDKQIAYLLAGRDSLQRAGSVGDVKRIVDAAAAAEIYSKRQGLSEETVALAYRLKTEALGKLGDLLAAMPKAPGQRLAGRERGSNKGVGGTKLVPPTNTPTLADLGLDKKTSSIAQQLASLDQKTRETIAAREVSLSEAMRTHRRSAAKPVELPEGKYRVIYADPPWSYGNSGVITDSDAYGRAERHYQTMTILELCAMDVKAKAARDSVLFLWVTSPLLGECWPVIDAWGFTYKTSMVWDKDSHNYGNYVSVRHEFLLICTRGSCLPDNPTPMPDSVVTAKRSKTHSEKPAEFRAIIDRLYDGGADQKLELFARHEVEGWTAHGDRLD